MSCQTIRELKNLIVSRRLPPLENNHRIERNPRNQRNATHEMTCPVCYEQTDLLKVCGNGHDLCRDCLGKCWNTAQTCPQCREPMTEAYAKAGLLNVPRANDDDDIPPLDYPIGAVWPPENNALAPRLRDDLTTETHIYNPRTYRWIRNNNANRLRILGNGGHRPTDQPLGDAPEIIEQRNGFNRRQPGDRYVIAGLVMEVVRDVRPWHA